MRVQGLREDRHMKAGLRGLMAKFQMKTNFAAVEKNRRARRRKNHANVALV